MRGVSSITGIGTRLVEQGGVVSELVIDLIHEHIIVRLRHSLPDGKLQKEDRDCCERWQSANSTVRIPTTQKRS